MKVKRLPAAGGGGVGADGFGDDAEGGEAGEFGVQVGDGEGEVAQAAGFGMGGTRRGVGEGEEFDAGEDGCGGARGRVVRKGVAQRIVSRGSMARSSLYELRSGRKVSARMRRPRMST